MQSMDNSNNYRNLFITQDSVLNPQSIVLSMNPNYHILHYTDRTEFFNFNQLPIPRSTADCTHSTEILLSIQLTNPTSFFKYTRPFIIFLMNYTSDMNLLIVGTIRENVFTFSSYNEN